MTPEAEVDESTRQKRMRQVRAIIDKANDPAATPEERDSFLEAADRLMTKFVIEMWELEFAKPAGQREKPVMRTFEVPRTGEWDFRQACASAFQYLAQLCRIKIGGFGWTMKVFGYESDLDYLDMVYTSVLLDMTSHMDPKPVPGVSWETNMANLRWSGKKWEDIHRLLANAELPDYPYNGQRWERRIGVRFTAVMKRVAEDQGRARNMNSDNTRWRSSFIEGYIVGLHRQIRRLQGEQEKAGGLVLAGREDAIMEALWEEFPEQRPHPDDCECDQCHYLRCRDASCKRPRCVAGRKPVRYARARKYVDNTDYTAMDQGRARGEAVNLARGGISNRKGELDG